LLHVRLAHPEPCSPVAVGQRRSDALPSHLNDYQTLCPTASEKATRNSLILWDLFDEKNGRLLQSCSGLLQKGL